MGFDAMAILARLTLALVVEPVAGPVVDDEEDFATVVPTHELTQELEERGAVEHRREPERELGSVEGVEGNRAEHVRGLPQSIGVDTRLSADPRQWDAGAVPPEPLVYQPVQMPPV
jgi:hypothetical protein